jgi:hypothetical protein
MPTISGKEFNELYKDNTFIKPITKSGEHNGFRFKSGYNTDTIHFDPDINKPGGFTFYDEYDMGKYLHYNNKTMHYIRYVTIPDSATVSVEYPSFYSSNGAMRFKTNKFILSKKILISEHELWADEHFCLKALKHDITSFQYMKNPSELVCIEAVKKNGLLLQYIPNQTESIYIAAFKQNKLAKKYVKDSKSLEKIKEIETLQKGEKCMTGCLYLVAALVIFFIFHN